MTRCAATLVGACIGHILEAWIAATSLWRHVVFGWKARLRARTREAHVYYYPGLKLTCLSLQRRGESDYLAQHAGRTSRSRSGGHNLSTARKFAAVNLHSSLHGLEVEEQDSRLCH